MMMMARPSLRWFEDDENDLWDLKDGDRRPWAGKNVCL